VLTDDYLDPRLAELNARFLGAGRRWMLAKASGIALWCGPLLEPGRTGCWACLEQRLNANRQLERYLVGRRDGKRDGDLRPGTVPAGPAAVPLAGALLAHELAKAVVGVEPARPHARMVTLHAPTLEMAEHFLVRLPQCPACGDPSLISGRSPKVVLAQQPVAAHVADGGYRVEPPTETYDRLKHHISPYLGAVTSLVSLTPPGNEVAHTYTAGHNFAMLADNMALLRRNLRGQSGGKGRTDIQAKVSALCEAIERYSGVWRGDEPVTRASYAELGPELAVHPDEFVQFSLAQRAVRDAWNADPRNRLHVVPEEFDTDRPVDWSTAWSLTNDRERRVPAAYAWFGHPDLNSHFYTYSDSNGNAAGSTIEEAIAQGFCELVERDAVAIWWYNRLACPEFDLDSLDDPYVETVRRHYATQGRSLWVLDITSDLGVPAFAGVSHRIDHPVNDIVVGFGAHWDARVAVLRAITEVNQFMPSVEQRDAGGNTVYVEDDPSTLAWFQEAKLAEEPWLTPDPGTAATTLATYPFADADLAETVRDLVRRAASAGLEVIVLDQSRPEINLSVVKVMAPRMRHFWRRLGPGRLYEVPVRTGRLAAPLTEDQVNPRSVFF
jgi:ribosomal protein S12 methylthiotransferase accessory factor